jgi:1-pyrroline-5-carboxylate dehydrogenase
MPPGVINFLPGDAVAISQQLLDSPDLGGIHHRQHGRLQQHGEDGRREHRPLPRLPSAGRRDRRGLHRRALSADPQKWRSPRPRRLRYQARSAHRQPRLLPESLWGEVRDRTIAMMKDIKMGDVRDFRNFMGAVIDKKAFTRISEHLDDAKKNAKVL